MRYSRFGTNTLGDEALNTDLSAKGFIKLGKGGILDLPEVINGILDGVRNEGQGYDWKNLIPSANYPDFTDQDPSSKDLAYILVQQNRDRAWALFKNREHPRFRLPDNRSLRGTSMLNFQTDSGNRGVFRYSSDFR